MFKVGVYMQCFKKFIGLVASATLVFTCQARPKKYRCNDKSSLTASQEAVCQELKNKRAYLDAKRAKIRQELIALEDKQLRKGSF